MTKNNVTSINFQSSQPTVPLTLQEVQNAQNVWRQNKKTRSEKIPESLWDQVLGLLETHSGPESKILAALGIGRPQLEAERQRRQLAAGTDKNSASPAVDTVDFYEVPRKSAPEPAQY